jgi:glycerol-3-phosphate dehydrogenase
MENPGWRASVWTDLQQPWDVIVIGGGIVGAGVFREAVEAGLNTLLLEGHDFSSGTSSRSSKMVHGGLRYLKNAQVKLTLDSSRERQRLIHEGAGLIDPLYFNLVNYQGDHTPGWVFGLGLIAYDLLALRWKHSKLSRQRLKEICPQLNEKHLVGGYGFYDAQTDDARLVYRVIQEGQAAGGTAINYARVADLLRNSKGKVCGVQVKDALTGTEKEVRAGLVINASGAWADELRGKIGKPPRLRLLRGSHLIFTRERVPLDDAISFLHPVDHRPVFAFSWEGATLVGTTDVDHDHPMSTDPWISPQETDYLMQAANHIFDCLNLTTDDVLSTFAGIRSVLDTGKADPSKEARDEILWDEDGLITITGGKLTMFSHMAQRTLRFTQKYLPEKIKIDKDKRALDLVNGHKFKSILDYPGLSAEQKIRLLGRYSHNTPNLILSSHGKDFEKIHETPTLWAELKWAARHEQVIHLEDLLLRRTRIGSLFRKGGLPIMQQIRELCQPQLGWDDSRWQTEVLAYQQLYSQSYSLSQPLPA